MTDVKPTRASPACPASAGRCPAALPQPDRSWRPFLPRVVVAFLLAALALTAPAQAQLSNKDMGQLIEGLRQWDMPDLLDHLARTEDLEDPVLAQQVAINLRYLEFIRAKQQAAQAADSAAQEALKEEALDALDQTIRLSRELILSDFDHEQRPIFQTQLAEMLLLEYLPYVKVQAEGFYEFGVPSAEQREAFESTVAEALELMESADITFFRQQTELPKQPDHVARRVDTGLWDRMMGEFYQVRAPYVFAHALYYVWLLPDNHPYYQSLGKNRQVIRQKATVTEERARLLSLAMERLDDVLRASQGRYRDLAPRVQSLRGRVAAAQADAATATAAFAAANEAAAGDLWHLYARLGETFLHAGQGSFGDALRITESLASHKLLTGEGTLAMRLLVTDATHRVLLQQAQARPPAEQAQALAQAYQPYLDLLDDPRLSPAEKQSLRVYIYQRWASSVSPEADLSQVPAVVAAAIGQMRFAQGQALMLQADDEEQAGNSAQAEALREEGRAKLRSAAEVNHNLSGRPNLAPQVAASARYHQALATYWLDRGSDQAALEAARVLIELAETYPDQELAATALADATGGVLRPLLQRPQIPSEVPALYERAVGLLLAEHPTLPAAHNQRYFYALAVLYPRGDYAAAADVLDLLPADHPDYFLARRDLLYVMMDWLRAGEGEQPELVARLRRDAQALREEAERRFIEVTPERRSQVLQAAGHARLVLADLAARQDDFAQALELLAGFEQDYQDAPDLVQAALTRRIDLYAQAQEYDAALEQARAMMQRWPQQAVGVIERVVRDLDQRAQALQAQRDRETVTRRRDLLRQQQDRVARLAVELAQVLVAWGEQQGIEADQMVPYRLVLGRALRTTGDYNQALTQLEPILARFSQDPMAILEVAETLYAKGTATPEPDPAILVQAGEHYSKLLSGLRREESGRYPEMYWLAWMRWFQIADRLGQNTSDIGLTVRKLRLIDPNLGGEPYRTALQTLENKYPAQ